MRRPEVSALAWMAHAACADAPDLPWVADAADVTAFEAARMRTVCAGCPVRGACEQYADAEQITGGWWAGHDRDTLDVLAAVTSAQGVLPLEFAPVGDAA